MGGPSLPIVHSWPLTTSCWPLYFPAVPAVLCGPASLRDAQSVSCFRTGKGLWGGFVVGGVAFGEDVGEDADEHLSSMLSGKSSLNLRPRLKYSSQVLRNGRNTRSPSFLKT
jgi:hypothetical protein